jgi:hypothetical protein
MSFSPTRTDLAVKLLTVTNVIRCKIYFLITITFCCLVTLNCYGINYFVINNNMLFVVTNVISRKIYTLIIITFCCFISCYLFLITLNTYFSPPPLCYFCTLCDDLICNFLFTAPLPLPSFFYHLVSLLLFLTMSFVFFV